MNMHKLSKQAQSEWVNRDLEKEGKVLLTWVLSATFASVLVACLMGY